MIKSVVSTIVKPVVRSIGSSGQSWTPQDDNADAYILAEGIADLTAKAAITKLVIALKAINLIQANFVNFDNLALSNRKAIYLLPGTVALTNKRNLMSPGDSDGEFRCTSVAEPNVTTSGVKFAAGTKFDTKLNSLANLGVDDYEIGISVSEHKNIAGTPYEIGSGATLRMIPFYGTVVGDGTMWVNSGDQQILGDAWGVVNGFYQTNRQGSAIGALKLIINGVVVASNPGVAGGTLPDANIFLGYVGPENRLSYAGIGKSITDLANVEYLKAIEEYQYDLNLRLKLYNIIIEGHSFVSGQALIKNPLITGLIAGGNVLPYHVITIGSGGATVTTMNSRVATVAKWYKEKDLVPFKNIMVIWIGINNLNQYADLKAYVIARKAEGWDYFFVLTITPTGNAGDVQAIIDWNNNLRNDLTTIAGVHIVDTDLIPELTDETNLTYFNADQLHLTQAGYNLAAEALVAKMESIF